MAGTNGGVALLGSSAVTLHGSYEAVYSLGNESNMCRCDELMNLIGFLLHSTPCCADTLCKAAPATSGVVAAFSTTASSGPVAPSLLRPADPPLGRRASSSGMPDTQPVWLPVCVCVFSREGQCGNNEALLCVHRGRNSCV